MSDSKITHRPDEDEIDLLALFGTLWDSRWLIASITLAFTVIGVAYALLATPVYKATSLIQVEDEQASMPGMEDISSLLGSASTATTEIQLIKSRAVLGNVVDELGLDVVVEPNHFPVVGQAIARRFVGSDGELAEPLLGEQYAWGGEVLEVSRLEVPAMEYGDPLTLHATDSGWLLKNSKGEPVLEGIVGRAETSGDYALTVKELMARPGTTFELTKRRRFSAIAELQEDIGASEVGKDSGIISLSYQHNDYQLAERVLNEVGNHYVRQNVERNSAEAAKSLDFLRKKLPEVKHELETAEERLNEFQIRAETIDITAEGEAILEQVVELEKQISELEIKRAEIEQRFRPSHPRYKAWASQMEELKERRQELDSRIGGLPETQQELVRLRRNVEVGNEIYLEMLSNIQQLDIVRAGTVGSVRVVDKAAVNVQQPVSPKKLLIIAIGIMTGVLFSTALVLIQSLFNRGVESADDIEAIGIPVYAVLPVSQTQEAMSKEALKRGSENYPPKARLLATENPADLAIESLRSLRTSLKFAVTEAKKNVLMITGPSPRVGKSFLSANLAAVFAQTQQKILLIDADMRRGYTHNTLGVGNERGLTDFLSNQVQLETIVQPTNDEYLHFISRGSVAPNPSELLQSKRLSKLIEDLSEKYDWVIIDTPPIGAVTDSAIIGQQVGLTLLTAKFGVNSIKEIELAKKKLEFAGICINGCVLNAVKKRPMLAGYEYYLYDYKTTES
ncbi:polysaccharide biosynthesis tyrosine autokinase [Marinobacter sp. F4216]|uniref:polysaccharide biosynthesis tyrosine autokinase n=1 Tax=Marinobacter sp. F4216 TaxID=2874281 RepID=UPI001CBDC211|nr:polysaccharide biosynthesis tyrosine autokinase [Marinobacter sp. F4216]MBZ2168432.1 polysaccharide biosynthesis tyrosine autokinase [Marinobacter sp. F4216]